MSSLESHYGDLGSQRTSDNGYPHINVRDFATDNTTYNYSTKQYLEKVEAIPGQPDIRLYFAQQKDRAFELLGQVEGIVSDEDREKYRTRIEKWNRGFGETIEGGNVYNKELHPKRIKYCNSLAKTVRKLERMLTESNRAIPSGEELTAESAEMASSAADESAYGGSTAQ